MNIKVLFLLLPALLAFDFPAEKPKDDPKEVMQAVLFCSRDGYVSVRQLLRDGYVVVTISNTRCDPRKQLRPKPKKPDLQS